MLTPSLTAHEKRLVKALLKNGERSQDVHILVNTGREPTVNFSRVSAVKNANVQAASDAEVSRYRLEKSLVDLQTGLSPFMHERLARSREAMLLAVQIFNLPLLRFKVEVFAVLSHIAWTYLLHEFFERKGISITHQDGSSILLSQMLKRPDVPLSKGVINNIIAVKTIRDNVEHKLLNAFGETFYGVLQANCLNFENYLCSIFGSKMSLGRELSYALQLSRISLSQASALQSAENNGPIQAVDAELNKLFSPSDMADPEFMFKVAYSLEKSSKGESHFVFSNNLGDTHPHNILIKKVAADVDWPYKPKRVLELVKERTGVELTYRHHTQAWRKLGVRPKAGTKNPADTKPAFCTYHPAHGDYTYSEAWVDALSKIVANKAELTDLKSFKL